MMTSKWECDDFICDHVNYSVQFNVIRLIDDYTKVMMKVNDLQTLKKQYIYPLGKAAIKYNIPRSTGFLEFAEMFGVTHKNNL